MMRQTEEAPKSYTLEELEKTADYQKQNSPENLSRRDIIHFGNLNMLNNRLKEEEKR